MLAAAVTVLVLGFLVGYVLIRGVPNLTAGACSRCVYLGQPVDAARHSQHLHDDAVLRCWFWRVPFGICSAIYLVEYAKKGSKIVALVRVTTETLSGIPSIVYGLFGMLFFRGKAAFGATRCSPAR